MTEIEKIQANAALVLDMISRFKQKPNYDAQSVEWLEGHIIRIRNEEREPKVHTRLISMYGSFLGECMVRQYAGKWVEDENGWGVLMEGVETIRAYPFNKVGKLFNGGEGDSIYSFFTMTAILLKEKPNQVQIVEARKRWWKFW